MHAEKDSRKQMSDFFKSRQGFFFKRDKLLAGEAYASRVIDPYQVFGENYPVSSLYLVGDNWLDTEDERPVAMLWGFNNWKLGFVSDYLKDYRTVFAPRKILAVRAVSALRSFPVRPKIMIFWGYTEPWILRTYARLAQIPVYRMEDGFLRSANLGASHSTPYSLIMDAQGIHYDPRSESDLEKILSGHDFSTEELAQSRECLALFTKLNLSKYNPPSFEENGATSIKIRRRVAVIGQVDNDKSVQLGNIDNWTMKELIHLAKMENPDADIVYRPHPDVYKGYQRSRFKARSVENVCTIANPDVPITEFLATIDHVYTITSLTGLEALVRGLKVTVVGAAFYAGWGLTDDRVSFERRRRSRSLEELFAAVYLRYPKYLASLHNSHLGFKSACLAIKADYESEKFRAISAMQDFEDNVATDIAASHHWPQLFFAKRTEQINKKVIGRIDFSTFFRGGSGHFFQVALCYSMCGQCESNGARELFLTIIRKYLDPNFFGQLLLELSRVYPGQYIAKQFAWLLAALRNPDASIEVLSAALHENIKEHQLAQAKVKESDGDEPAEEEGDGAVAATPSKRMTHEQAELQLEIFEYRVMTHDTAGAVEIAKVLLLEGYFAVKLLPRLQALAELRFDDSSARAIARLSYYQSLSSRMAAAEAKAFHVEDVLRDPWNYVALLAKVVVLKPSMIAFALAMLKRFEDDLDISEFEQMLTGLLALNGVRSVEMAQALIAIERPDSAVRMIEDLIDSGDNSPSTRITYSQALSYAGRLGESMAVMSAIRRTSKTSPIYRESLRLFILAGDYASALELVEDAIERRVDIGDMLPRKIYFGSRMPEKAFKTFTEQRLTRTLQGYYPEKYLTTEAIDDSAASLLLLAIFGPGDEIRFASIYNLLPKMLPNKTLSISCDPRLKPLFELSFPEIEFIGVARPRSSDRIDMNDYSRVLGSDLCGVVDNTATDKIDASDRVMVLTDMLHKCLPSYEAFPGRAYLRADPALKAKYQAKLPTDRLLVGLSWRSSITTHSRNEHYLSVEELEPIFSIEGVQFVNLQYDNCDAELAWVESRYPGKIVNIPEVDQFNDFGSVAAIMMSMDLILAPATTVVELSGALGCPTWLLSNSSELHWRKIDAAGTDVWNRSVTHVEGTILGDKSSLVAEIDRRLREYVDSKEVVAKLA